MKKYLSLVLALAMMLSLFACSKPQAENSNPPAQSSSPVESQEPGGEDVYTGPDWDALAAMDYDSACDYMYAYVLDDYSEALAIAKAELDDVDMRNALMAIAEAKMLESGVFAPYAANGGSYAMTHVVPRSATTTSWGLDEYRFYTTMVCKEFLKTEDRDKLISIWVEAEDADAYYAAAEAYLTEKGYTLKDSYNTYSSYDLATWDVIATSYTSDSYFSACTYAPLLEYDAKNVQQPGVAKSYEISADGLTYTFHLRDGVYWVDQQGRQMEKVTANDWVTGMMHVADNNDALGYLFSIDEGCGIKNYDAYINGECTFDDVGVKAIDDLTLQYTLEAKFPAFLTMLGYGCFAPVNYKFYKSQGGTFGAEGDEYTAGNYGTSPSTIAYCGPMLVTNYTPQNITSYKANPSYWDADHVHIQTLSFYYVDGSEPLRTYTDAKAGVFDGCVINSSAMELAKTEIPEGESKSYFDLYHYTSATDSTTFCGWVNVNRAMYHNFNDDTQGISTKADDEAEQARTRAALANQHFRLALCYSFDRGAYEAQGVGEDLKYTAVVNSYTTGTFVMLENDTTVDINGTATTFPAGTYYGEILQAQLTADGSPIKVWDPNADGGVGSSAGFDGWYNAANAAAELELAIAELAQVGVEISAENPIHIDSPYNVSDQIGTNQMNAFKQSIESALGSKVIVDLVGYPDRLTMQYSYYRHGSGDAANYDFAPGSGWGPDYGDPMTFLNTIQEYGYMCKNIGLY